jgi:hypothetical protein
MNPKSLQNLQPRQPFYDEPKNNHGVSVTSTGWKGTRRAAKAIGISSVSGLLEAIGRGTVSLVVAINLPE